MIRRILLLAVLVLGLSIPAVRAQDEAAAGYDQTFELLRQFYAARDYRPVWTNRARFTSRGSELPDLLAASVKHGLNPEDYGVNVMKAFLEDRPEDAESWQQAEVFWTYNLWQYASALAGQPLDAVTLENVVDGDLDDNLAELAPDQPLYKALQDSLAQIDAHADAPAVTPISFGVKLFKPGMVSAQVPLLRDRMRSYSEEALADTSNTYDPALAKAVSRYQEEYGLKNDGSIGPVTLSILNRTPADERMQIVANLQRLREPHRRLREDKRIEVSIARYRLTAYESGKEALTMPVVVGQPRRQTISFRTEITGVRLNPTWTVPDTIKKEDFLPMLVSDPAMLVKKHGVNVVRGGKIVDPKLVDWTQLTPRELAQVGFWRAAGDGNPLGRYRVIMQNPYDIYLHDTNHRDLFAKSMRAQSSGCVRVGSPEVLTDFILKGLQGWNPQKIKQTVAAGQTKDVIIENKIPIYLDYMTAWFNDRGQLILGVDVYDLDKPRYDVLVKNGLTTQRNAQRILTLVPDILEPELKEAQHRDAVLTQSTN